MSVKDHSAFYQAGARALKILAARCGEEHLARIFENQAERFLLMAEVCAQGADAVAPPPPRLVAAKRPNFSRRPLPPPGGPARAADVVDLAAARGRREI